MLVQVEIYGIGVWFQEVAIEKRPTPSKGWIETDNIRRITVLRKELIEWVEHQEVTVTHFDEPWLVRVLSLFPRNPIPKEQRFEKTVREQKETGDKFEYWEIVYFDGNEVCIVPKGELVIFSIDLANRKANG